VKACEVCGAPLAGKRPSAKVCSDACRQRKARGVVLSPGEAPDPTAPQLPGAVEAKVRSDVEALTTAHPVGEALAEMSYTLARTLDQGAGLGYAAVARELRANLIELARLQVDHGDDLGDVLSNPSAGFGDD
jgi:hypothetical protein